MLFNSVEFILFLPLVFLLYWFVFKPRKMQNLLLLAASYVFYGWWDWRFLLLIVATSLSSYMSGLLIAQFEGNRTSQRLVSTVNIVFNLLILATFKYFNFFVENLDALFSAMGYKLDWVTLDVILPVGISFYTFQALSYSIDVYRHAIKPTRSMVDFFAYISFFPQLVAGPIERATCLLPQFQAGRTFSQSAAIDGSRQMLWGFFKKMVVADTCAYFVNMSWDNYASLSSVNLLLLGVLFTVQIYCDFSGYSDIAIGCARLFGFNLTRNFNYPYFSRSIPEFWRRWHISLMSWFRDYIYIPLGGSRCARSKVLRNVLVVFLVSGLWHGANWTFVVWGLYHAVIICIYIVLGINTKTPGVEESRRWLPSLKNVVLMLFTFVLAVVGWIIFRATSMTEAWQFLSGLATRWWFDGFVGGKFALLLAVPVFLAEWVQRSKQHALQFSGHGLCRYRLVRWAIYYLLLYAIYRWALLQDVSQTFIYFQF